MAEENGVDQVNTGQDGPATDSPRPTNDPNTSTIAPSGDRQKDEEDAESSEEEDEEESEPHLKYTKLTGFLTQTFKGKDSVSASLVSGDKFIIGTHNGSIYVYALPSMELLRSYKAHSASITAISVSPYSPSISPSGLSLEAQAAQETPSDRPVAPSRAPTQSSVRSSSTASPNSKRARPTPSGLPPTSSNLIYIGTSSLDGHVCVSSLTDPNDVTLRNFARPVQSVALSPDYKTSRSYLSGGLAGHLILTTGGKQGSSENANTINAAAAASGWLGQIGLGSSTGRDAILHQGEGSVSAIRYSLSGKFVAWVNETGIKIMRSSFGLGTEDQELAWRRIAHVDKPKSRAWEENGSLWRARTQWVDEQYLEKDEAASVEANGVAKSEKKTERLLVGWGDTVWLVHVYGEGSAARTGSAKGFKAPSIVHKFDFDDGVVSGLTLYTPKLLLALIFRTRDDDDRPINSTQDTPRKGIHKRQNGMPPEMRLIDISSDQSEELEIESFTKLDRHQSLSFADYHLSTVYFSTRGHASKDARSSLGVLGDGLWDVSRNATRLFSSNASIRSGSSSDVASDRRSTATSQATTAVSSTAFSGSSLSRGLAPDYTKPGLKIFIISPFDSLLAVKRDQGDHLRWLREQKKYEQAWNYVDQNPEVVAPQTVSPLPQSRPETPSKAHETLADFLDDDSSSSSSAATVRAKSRLPAVAREKRLIGDMWVQQLVDAGQWDVAGHVANKVIDLPERWEHWISTFAKADKFDEISSHLPTQRMKPAISPRCYEDILEYYIEHDRVHLQALINTWNTDLFDTDRVTAAIQSKLDSDERSVRKPTASGDEDDPAGRDWRILQDSLAHLYLAANRPADALQCFLLTRNADPAIKLVKENQLFSSIFDDVYDFATLRVSPGQAANAPLSELDELSSDAISLLASAASQNIIPVSSAVSQFQAHSPAADPYLFFYFRTLWNGDVSSLLEQEQPSSMRGRRSRFAPTIPTNTTRHLLAPYGDLAVTLFATYAPPLLNALLRARDASDDPAAGGSLPYSFEHASAVCETHGLTAELVYLLAATGQTREALHRICEGASRPPSAQGDPEDDDTHDAQVKWAIAFCHEVDDQSLWDDLLSFSLKHPTFLRGLMLDASIGADGSEQESTSGIDPIELVRKIPDGVPIPGLKGALERLVKDANVQQSIANGAAQVLRSEIMAVMSQVVDARKRGVAFEVEESPPRSNTATTARDAATQPAPTAQSTNRVCALCDDPYTPSLTEPTSQDHLIAYPCTHIYHLSCLFDAFSTSATRRLVDEIQSRVETAAAELQSGADAGWRRGRVGSKVARMQMIGRVLEGRGCVRCERDKGRRP